MTRPDLRRFLVGKLGTMAIVLGVLLFGFWLGGLGQPARTEKGTETAAFEAKTQEVWTCSMHPQVREPKPGPCPICGMDLVRAPDDAKAAEPKKPEEAKPEEAPKYACSMFCVPPLPKPGKCPICGMEMVEVKTAAAEKSAASDRQLKLSPKAEKLAEIRLAPVERKFVEARVRLVGKVTYDETRVAYITSWIAGRLDRLYVDYTGVAVEQGDRLVYIYSPELLSAQEELFQAKRAAVRLKESSLPSMRETAKKTVVAVREKLRLYGLSAEQVSEIERRGTPSDHISILAPMSGIVVHKNAREGMYVATGTRIYTIADLSTVWVKLDVYESDLPWVRYGQEVEFSTEAYPGEVFRGKIAFIDPVLDDRTRTVKVRVNVPNADGSLKPDMFVRAIVRSRVAAGGKVMDASLAGKWISPKHPEIVKDGPGVCDKCGVPLVRAETLGYVTADRTESAAPLVVPHTAPLITGKRAVVYVALKDEPGLYEGRTIELGPRAGDHYIVSDGLAEGEMVVVNGAFKIDSAIQIRARPSMMNPAGGPVAPGDAPEGEGRERPADPTGPVAKGTFIPPSFRARLAPLFDAYLEIQAALAKDRHEPVLTAATALQKALGAVDTSALDAAGADRWSRDADAVADSARAVAEASDITAAREAFAGLSEAMIAVADTFGTGLEKPVHRVRCPMAFDNRGAAWLQLAEKTENPYYGAAMYRCGARQATYEPKPTKLGPQTVCPIMGKAIVREVFTDHDGKRIYFCCPPCIEKFEADPERYLKEMAAAGERPEPTPEK